MWQDEYQFGNFTYSFKTQGLIRMMDFRHVVPKNIMAVMYPCWLTLLYWFKHICCFNSRVVGDVAWTTHNVHWRILFSNKSHHLLPMFPAVLSMLTPTQLFHGKLCLPKLLLWVRHAVCSTCTMTVCSYMLCERRVSYTLRVQQRRRLLPNEDLLSNSWSWYTALRGKWRAGRGTVSDAAYRVATASYDFR